LRAKRARLAFAIVDDARDFGTQILAMHDAVDEAVLEKKLAGLEAVGQFEADRVLDRALAGEADQSTGLGQGDVPLKREAGGDARRWQ